MILFQNQIFCSLIFLTMFFLLIFSTRNYFWPNIFLDTKCFRTNSRYENEENIKFNKPFKKWFSSWCFLNNVTPPSYLPACTDIKSLGTAWALVTGPRIKTPQAGDSTSKRCITHPATMFIITTSVCWYGGVIIIIIITIIANVCWYGGVIIIITRSGTLGDTSWARLTTELLRCLRIRWGGGHRTF